MTTPDTVADQPGSAVARLPMPGPIPVATASARRVGVLLALLVLMAGAVAIRDSAVGFGALSGTSWTGAVLAATDKLHSQWWMVPVGCVALVAGLWLMFLAVRPRRRTAVSVTAAGSVCMRPRDVARLSAHAASTVPGVEVLRSDASRRKVTLLVGLADAASTAEAKGAVVAAVGSATEMLLPAPRVSVRVGTSGSR